MDSLITAAARALAAGDPLGALKRVALRDDAPALALRGIAMAQLGDFAREGIAAECGARLRSERTGCPREMRWLTAPLELANRTTFVGRPAPRTPGFSALLPFSRTRGAVCALWAARTTAEALH